MGLLKVPARRSAAPRPPRAVVMQSSVVANLSSGRVRAMVLPAREFGRLQRGDLLWVREGVTIEDRQQRRGELRVRYWGQTRPVAVPWPPALARPHAGTRRPEGMPVECSRFTLRVLEAQERSMRGLTDGEALECGAEAVEGGWCPPATLQDSFLPYASAWEAVGHVWDQEHGFGSHRDNPDVVLVRFEALARNIGKVAPGMGFGGARA